MIRYICNVATTNQISWW